MIKKIVIRDVASYDHEGCTFDDLAKVNIIYGGNGTGKTTLSKMSGLQRPEGEYENCLVERDAEFDRLRVFMKGLMEHFLREESQGIYTLDDVTEEEMAELKRLSAEQDKAWRNVQANADGTEAYQKAFKAYLEIYQEVKEMEEKLSNTRHAVASMNRMLKKYGFTNFSLVPLDEDGHSFQIRRADGTYVKKTLSEGEETFVQFLYFMHQAKGDGIGFGIVEPRVLVIDDPISSLDSHILYVVSMMVRSLIEEALNPTTGWVRQVIVLTHNVAFHRLISQRSPHKDIHYWILSKRNGVSKVKAYGEENPIRNEYEMLWREVREAKEGEPKVGLANTMRRIIETYFIENGGYTKRRLIPDGFLDDPEELAIMTSWAKWADEESHSVLEAMYGGNVVEMNERFLEVFKRLFEKLGHGAHYKMMMHEE